MGLVIFGAMALYLLISIAVVIGAIAYARKHGRSAARWGAGAALTMYLLMFWDHIPTVVAHKYYCEKEAGFWVYKTPEQWKKENPGVLVGLAGRAITRQKIEKGQTEIHQLNQRINWEIKLDEVVSALQVSRRQESLVDTKSNEVLTRFIDFSRGSQRSTGSAKFWLVSSDCHGGEVYRMRMGQLIDEIYASAKGDKK